MVVEINLQFLLFDMMFPPEKLYVWFPKKEDSSLFLLPITYVHPLNLAGIEGLSVSFGFIVLP